MIRLGIAGIGTIARDYIRRCTLYILWWALAIMRLDM